MTDFIIAVLASMAIHFCSVSGTKIPYALVRPETIAAAGSDFIWMSAGKRVVLGCLLGGESCIGRTLWNAYTSPGWRLQALDPAEGVRFYQQIIKNAKDGPLREDDPLRGKSFQSVIEFRGQQHGSQDAARWVAAPNFTRRNQYIAPDQPADS